jgi:hypothetical protein
VLDGKRIAAGAAGARRNRPSATVKKTEVKKAVAKEERASSPDSDAEPDAAREEFVRSKSDAPAAAKGKKTKKKAEAEGQKLKKGMVGELEQEGEPEEGFLTQVMMRLNPTPPLHSLSLAHSHTPLSQSLSQLPRPHPLTTSPRLMPPPSASSLFAYPILPPHRN